MNILTTISAPQSIETRRSQRNLNNFLDYRFDENKKLSLTQEKVHGHSVECLKGLDSQQINWKNFPLLWWNDSLNLRKISHYVASKAPLWAQLLNNDSNKLIALERQCALLEKVIEKYNFNVTEKKSKKMLIPFVSPLKKVLRVIISYPEVIGQPTRLERVQDICFDRLTSAKELSNRVEEAIDKPVLTYIFGATSTFNEQKKFYPLSVVAKNLFKKTLQEPQQLFDPTDNQLRESLEVLKVSYDDPDADVLPILFFKAGETQALSHVYEQGFVAGRSAGYKEAIERMQLLSTSNSAS